MAKFFNEEDLETIFLDAFDIGFIAASKDSEPRLDSKEAWNQYKGASHIFNKTPSKPLVDVKPEDMVCPDCGSKMVARTNRQSGSKFWGCSTFPKCRGTRNEEGLSKEEVNVEKMRKETPTGVNFSHQGVTWNKTK